MTVRQGRIQREVTYVEDSRAPDPDEIAKVMVDIAARHGAVLNVKIARLLLDAIVELWIRSAIEYGRAKLPQGWGSFILRVLYTKPQRASRLPTGEIFMRQPRAKLRYEEGSFIKQMLGTLPKRRYQRVAPIPSALPEEYRPRTLVAENVSSDDA